MPGTTGGMLLVPLQDHYCSVRFKFELHSSVSVEKDLGYL